MTAVVACKVALDDASSSRAVLWAGWRSVHEDGQARTSSMGSGLSSSQRSRGRCGPLGWAEDDANESMGRGAWWARWVWWA